MPGQLVPADQFQFCGPTNLSVSPVIDAERAINLYPEPGIASSKTRMGLCGRPGLSAPGVTTIGAGFGHTLWAGAGRLFQATGTHLYEVSHTGSILHTYGGSALSNSGPSPTPMFANGTQLLICDPQAGAIYNANPSGFTLDPVVNDAGSPAQFFGIDLEYLDGFYLAIATGASLAGANPNQVNASKNGDGTVWPVLSFVTLTGTADLPVRQCVLNGLYFILKQKSIEVFYNAGNSIYPFARVNGGTINLGCLAQASVVKFSNTFLWLGSDSTGYGQVYMMQGMNPVRVSNTAIEQMLTTFPYNPKLSFAKAYGYQEAGHTFYVLNLITSSLAGLSTGLTLVYDLTTGLWHERAFATGAYGSPLVPCSFASVQNFNGLNPNYVMDESTGQLWYSSILYPNDSAAGGSNPITYIRTAPHVGSQNRWFKYPRFELDGDLGTAAPILDYSNDGGRTFLGYNYPLAQAQDQGAPSTFKRFYANQLGRSRDRVFKTTITDDTNLIRIANAYLTAEATA